MSPIAIAGAHKRLWLDVASHLWKDGFSYQLKVLRNLSALDVFRHLLIHSIAWISLVYWMRFHHLSQTASLEENNDLLKGSFLVKLLLCVCHGLIVLGCCCRYPLTQLMIAQNSAFISLILQLLTSSPWRDVLISVCNKVVWIRESFYKDLFLEEVCYDLS
jgi:hypothetical protein